MGMSLTDLRALEALLTRQISSGDRAEVLQRKRAAVREQIDDAEAALCRHQIKESIV
jgi:hypothetical protein